MSSFRSNVTLAATGTAQWTNSFDLQRAVRTVPLLPAAMVYVPLWSLNTIYARSTAWRTVTVFAQGAPISRPTRSSHAECSRCSSALTPPTIARSAATGFVPRPSRQETRAAAGSSAIRIAGSAAMAFVRSARPTIGAQTIVSRSAVIPIAIPSTKRHTPAPMTAESLDVATFSARPVLVTSSVPRHTTASNVLRRPFGVLCRATVADPCVTTRLLQNLIQTESHIAEIPRATKASASRVTTVSSTAANQSPPDVFPIPSLELFDV